MSRIKYPYKFDPKKRRLASAYRRGKLLFFSLSLLISLATALFILFSGLHITIRNFVLQFPFSTLFNGFLVMLIFTITGFPLSFYSNYIFDRRYKLANYNLLNWFRDFLKINLINYVFTLLLVLALYFTINTFSPWWIYAGIFYIIFSIIVNYIYPTIIVPFMWKTEPYRDRSMKNKILILCKKLGVTHIKNVVVIKESEKSIRPNAVFMGFGNSKRIGLFDNLLNNFTRDEIECVIGHELGHYVNKDILRGLILESIMIFPTLFVIDYLVRTLSPIFGIQGISDLASLTLIGLINGTLAFLFMPLVNTHSRWRESEADKFALQHVNKPIAQISLEKRLADMHLAEVNVHPLIEFWLFTHPSTIKRIKMAENWNKKVRS
ncbi:MAG: M48 family metallopeptidase [Candidatus Aenigmatarchaeota archaeon]